MNDIELLDKAIIFATNAHHGMTRKASKTPYVIHPLDAMVIASMLTDDNEVIAAAVLHDIIEDTKFTSDDLAREFNQKVTKLVLADSENKRTDRPSEETWKIRKQETIDYTRLATREEKVVVFADKLSNLRSIYRDWCVRGEDVWNKFHQKDRNEHGWYYSSFLETCKDFEGTYPYNEYKELIGKLFGK